MTQNKDDINLNKRAAEILLDRLIDAVGELQSRLDTLEEKAGDKNEEVRAELDALKRLCADMRTVLDYKETIVSLGRNASAEGIIELIKDVENLKKFMSSQIERQAVISKILLSMIPFVIFTLGAIWYIFTNYLMK